MAYQHEIFISYRRTSTAGLWVQNHFRPLLEGRLNEIAPGNVRVFCDQNMAEGVNLSADLKRHIRNSGLLLSVWTADYFRSAWCMAEWQSFRDRERALGLFADEHPLGLIYPVRYADGANYHPDANQALCRKDFTKLNYPYESFRDSVKYLDFDELVQQVANDLVARLPDLPSWQPDFPVSEPLPMGPVGLARPVI